MYMSQVGRGRAYQVQGRERKRVTRRARGNIVGGSGAEYGGEGRVRGIRGRV